MKRFLEEMGEGYYALPSEVRRRTEIVAWGSAILGVAVVVHLIHYTKQQNKIRAQIEAERQRRKIEHERKMEEINQHLSRTHTVARKKMQDIVDKATNPTTEDLDDILVKLQDPTHVWEL